MPQPFAAPRLRRLAGRHRTAGRVAAARSGDAPREVCELCAEPLPPQHRHLLDVPAATPACACRACTVLFSGTAAAAGRYRLIPDRRVRLDSFTVDDALLAALGVPVDLAFFVREGEHGDMTVRYPSPHGVLHSTVEPAGWARAARCDPVLATLEDDVEAVLVNRTGEAREHWLVPVDDCYRLVAVVRAHWEGLAGGPEVREHLEEFFAQLRAGSPDHAQEAS